MLVVGLVCREFAISSRSMSSRPSTRTAQTRRGSGAPGARILQWSFHPWPEACGGGDLHRQL